MQPVRIVAVRYLNTVPLIEGLAQVEGVSLSLASPSHIGPMVASGDADIGLVSLIDGASMGLTALPVGMIGCDGPTLTVRLYSAVPLEQITRVHADRESKTSVVLCRVLLQKLHGVRAEMVEFDAREKVVVRGAGQAGSSTTDEWPEAMLLIGDKVVTDSPPAVRYPHQMDLGEAWKKLTGLPFVYATWMCRAQDSESNRVRLGAALIDRQLRHNLTRLDWIVSRRASEHRWPEDLARKYLCACLRFVVGEAEIAAATAFLEEARSAGIAMPKGLSWAHDLGGATPVDMVALSVPEAR